MKKTGVSHGVKIVKKILRTTMNKKVIAGAIILFFLSFFVGRITKGTDDHSKHELEKSVNDKGEVIWTCSMHPSVQLPEKGQCPICFMDLIPVSKGDLENSGDTPSLTLSENARNLAGIQTTMVIRQPATLARTLSGKVQVSQKKKAMITSRISGRLDTLFIDYEGQSISKGQKVAAIYSPELLLIQDELINAVNKNAENPSEFTNNLKNSAIEKLRLLGFNQKDIDNIIEKQKATDHMIIRADHSGYVLKKNVEEGNYVKTGMNLFHIADLSRVWIMLDAYENDIQWIRNNQKVRLRVQAWPNEIFEGKISYIDPVLNPTTRTVEVRVEAKNYEGKLKPDMLVYGDINIELNDQGTPHKKGDKSPLLIPVTSPLQTGKRAVVYIQTEKDSSHFLYEGREINLGPRVGDFFIVTNGLQQGDKVVTNGAFKIDGELQIKAQKSMMSYDEKGNIFNQRVLPQKSDKTLQKIFDNYLKLQESLTADSANSAIINLQSLRNNSQAITYIGGEGFDIWNSSGNKLKEVLKNRFPKDIENIRILFNDISDIIIPLEQYYGKNETFLAYCPMAFNNKGAFWIQKGKTINNPYFGASMLRCGEIKE